MREAGYLVAMARGEEEVSVCVGEGDRGGGEMRGAGERRVVAGEGPGARW